MNGGGRVKEGDVQHLFNRVEQMGGGQREGRRGGRGEGGFVGGKSGCQNKSEGGRRAREGKGKDRTGNEKEGGPMREGLGAGLHK